MGRAHERFLPILSAPLLFLLLVSGCASAYAAAVPNPLCGAPPCAPLISGWLHTNPGSTSVYDSNGNIVPLLGVNVDGLNLGTGNPASSPDSCGKGWSITQSSFTDVASWGFNSVRIPISWENIEPTAPTLLSNGTWLHHWNTPFLNKLDSVVSEFGKAQIPVILDFAQVDVSAAFRQAPEKVQGGECEGWGNPTWLYPGTTSPTTGTELATAMCNFFNDASRVGNKAPAPIEAMEAAETMLAARYVSNPTVVGIDMFNEPWFTASCGSTALEGDLLSSFYTKVGHAISGANPHLLLIFEEPPPGLMSETPIVTSAPTVPNAMYSFHIYTADWAHAQPYMQAYLGNAKRWGVPLWMGEFNAFEAGCTGVNCTLDQNWRADTQALLAYCSTNGVNWAFFSYYSLGTNLHTPVPKSDILAVLRSSLPLSTTTSSTATSTTTTSITSRVPEFDNGALVVALSLSMAAVGVLVGPRLTRQRERR